MKILTLLLVTLSFGSLCWAGSAQEDASERLHNAANVMREIMDAPDNGIPEEVLEHGKCVAVVPHMVKGGFIVGGKGGKGVATCRTANGWSAPAFDHFWGKLGSADRVGSRGPRNDHSK